MHCWIFCTTDIVLPFQISWANLSWNGGTQFVTQYLSCSSHLSSIVSVSDDSSDPSSSVGDVPFHTWNNLPLHMILSCSCYPYCLSAVPLHLRNRLSLDVVSAANRRIVVSDVPDSSSTTNCLVLSHTSLLRIVSASLWLAGGTLLLIYLQTYNFEKTIIFQTKILTTEHCCSGTLTHSCSLTVTQLWW